MALIQAVCNEDSAADFLFFRINSKCWERFHPKIQWCGALIFLYLKPDIVVEQTVSSGSFGTRTFVHSFVMSVPSSQSISFSSISIRSTWEIWTRFQICNFQYCYIPNGNHLHDDVIKWKHFRVTGPLCGELIGPRWSPLTIASDAELWCPNCVSKCELISIAIPSKKWSFDRIIFVFPILIVIKPATVTVFSIIP